MPHARFTVLNVARSGANVELSEDADQAASTLIELATIVSATGAHATINVGKHGASTVQEIARVGGRRVTLKF